MSEFRHKAIAGVSWSVASKLGRQGLAFVIGIVLVRLLSPREFGLVAMVTVVTSFAAVLSELGFGAALIQKQDVRQEHLSSVFWINAASGLLLTGLFVLGAPLISAFYDEALLVPLTMLISSTFLISALGNVQQTLFSKAVDFKTLALIEIVSTVSSGAVALAMAGAGFGVWSLAVREIVACAVTTGLLWVRSPWRPDFSFHWKAVRELLGFSVSLLGDRTLNYWVRNLDNLLIGKVLGTGALGIYSRAYQLMLFPLQNVSQVIARVLFPSLSTIQDDKYRVKRVYLKVSRAVAMVAFPLMMGLLVTAESFVLAVLGPQWATMTPVLRIFCVLGMAQAVGTLVGNLYLSQGKADQQFRLGLLLKPLLIAAIVVGLRWGIVGVAACITVVSLLCSYPSFYFAGRLVGLTYPEVLRAHAPIFACAAAMAALVFGIGHLLPETWPHWARLLVQVPSGAAAYGTLVHVFRLQAYGEVREVLQGVRRPRRLAGALQQEALATGGRAA